MELLTGIKVKSWNHSTSGRKIQTKLDRKSQTNKMQPSCKMDLNLLYICTWVGAALLREMFYLQC